MVIDYSEGHGYSIQKECEGCGVKLLENDLENFEAALRALKIYGIDFKNPEDLVELVLTLTAVNALLRERGQKIPSGQEHNAFWKIRRA